MTRKDYSRIAEALASARPPAAWLNKHQQWRYDVDAIADALAADNPRFNRTLFREACYS